MTFEGGHESNSTPDHHQQHHLHDWLDDSMSFLSTLLDDTYTRATAAAGEITSYEWWMQAQEQEQASMNCKTSLPPALSTANSSTLFPQEEFSEKRKKPSNPATANKATALQKRQKTAAEAGNEGDGEFVDEGEVNKKPAVIGKKGQGKAGAGSSGSGGSKEVRWAEQLLNPCAAAIEAANMPRVRHLFCVLKELQSLAGDANHRLAAHGLRGLTNYLSSADIEIPDRGSTGAAAPTFSTAVPKLFQSALIKFHEVSPWFSFPNALANASILQIVTAEPSRRAKSLHIVDVGVSHGVQWPTLLDALARRAGGAPPLVRLTIAGSAAAPGPFSAPPSGYDFRSHLLRYAKSIDLNLRINHANDLEAGSLALVRGETLVVCAQFRAGHGSADDRTSFLQSIRELDPDLVVVSDIDGGGGGDGVVRVSGFLATFAKKAELLWRFLDSTSAAFRGKDCAERQVIEGEAARVLEAAVAWAEERERWREWMAAAGFREEEFGEEAVDAGRALLRKYDGNWEMRTATAAVGLWWKGRPVSFSSLWKPRMGS